MHHIIALFSASDGVTSFIWPHMHMHMHMHIHMFMHMHMHVCIHVCVHMYMCMHTLCNMYTWGNGSEQTSSIISQPMHADMGTGGKSKTS